MTSTTVPQSHFSGNEDVTIEEVANYFGAEKVGKEYRAICPFHQDSDPSLSIEERDGKLFVLCRSACGSVFEKAIRLVKEQRGKPQPPKIVTAKEPTKQWKEFNFGEFGKGKVWCEEIYELKEFYEYRDEAGEVAIKARLFDPSGMKKKEFQWLTKQDGKLVPKKLIKVLPYRWELARERASRENHLERYVVITEGEKDANTVNADFELPAISSDQWDDAWFQELASSGNFRAYVLADNDEAGFKKADKICEALRKAGIKKVFRHAFPGHKSDVSDWRDEGHTQQDLVEIFKKLEPWEQSKNESPLKPEATSSATNEKALKIVENQNAPLSWPKLSEKAFHGVMGFLVEAAIENSEVDPAAVLLTGLAYSAAVFGKSVYLPIGDSRHAPCLMAIIVGSSSKARKGTSKGPVIRVFDEAFKLLKDEEPIKVSSGPLSTGEGLIYVVRDASEKLTKDGSAPEDPGVSDKRLLVIESEFGAPLKAMQREGNTLSAVIRMLWDGDRKISPITKGNRIESTDPHVCLVCHITQDELRELLETSDVWNGFANRFLWGCARRQKLVSTPQAMSAQAVSRIAQELSKAIAASKRGGDITLSHDTERVWDGLYSSVSRDIPGTLGAVTSRSEAQVLRLAMIYALLDSSRSIELAHLEAALAVWEYCLKSAEIIFGKAHSDPIANKILHSLKDGEKTQTELNNLFHGHASIQKVLADLQAMGRITQRKSGGGKGKGKPTTHWFCTPGFGVPLEDFEEFEE